MPCVRERRCFLGAILDTGTVWKFSELMNGLMAIPNLVALMLLSGQVREITLDYLNGMWYDIGRGFRPPVSEQEGNQHDGKRNW